MNNLYNFCNKYGVFAADPVPAPAAPLSKPRSPIRCGIFNRNVQDYTTSFDLLTKTCASLAYREVSAVRQLREYIANVQKTMSLDNMQRYARYTTQLTTDTQITAEQKQKKMDESRPIVDKALTDYNTNATKYQEQVKTLVAKLDATPVMQQCQQQAQNSRISQMSDANALMLLPAEMCDKMNSAYAAFEKVMDASYTKIGARIP